MVNRAAERGPESAEGEDLALGPNAALVFFRSHEPRCGVLAWARRAHWHPEAFGPVPGRFSRRSLPKENAPGNSAAPPPTPKRLCEQPPFNSRHHAWWSPSTQGPVLVSTAGLPLDVKAQLCVCLSLALYEPFLPMSTFPRVYKCADVSGL